jgi:hypothetical protein
MALSGKPFRIGHMYIYKFLLTMTDIMTSQKIDLSSLDALCGLVTNDDRKGDRFNLLLTILFPA